MQAVGVVAGAVTDFLWSAKPNTGKRGGVRVGQGHW